MLFSSIFLKLGFLQYSVICILLAMLLAQGALAESLPPLPLKEAQKHSINSSDSELDEVLNGFEQEEKITQESTKKETSNELDAVFEGFDESKSSSEDLDELLDNFDQAPSEQNVSVNQDKQLISSTQKNHHDFSYSGYAALDLSYNYAHHKPDNNNPDFRGLSRLRSSLYLELEDRLSEQILEGSWKVFASLTAFYDVAYAWQGREQYSQQLLKKYEDELELKDTYIQGSLTSNLDLKVGRQIVVWGVADNIRINDVLNPLDLREPALADIEDIRIPVAMTKFDYYFGQWNLSGIIKHERRFNKIPVFNSEFYPGNQAEPDKIEPSGGIKNSEYGLALKGFFSGWDLSFYWAHYFENEAHWELNTSSQIKQKYSQLNLYGSSLNFAKKNWLFKTEIAYIDGLKYFALPAGQELSRIDFSIGIEYEGFSDTHIQLEIANRHIRNYDRALDNSIDDKQKDQIEMALYLQQDYFHDTLHLVVLAQTLGLKSEFGSLQRLSLEYDINDKLTVKGGVMLYHGGESVWFNHIKNNDRLFFNLKYYF